MSNFIDAHWFPLASQGNIYSMTKLCSMSRVNKVVVASLRRKIYSCEYDITQKLQLRPVIKELLFTYIPNGAEIIAIDAYNKTDIDDGFVIGITIIKTSGDTSVERYLNIYSEGVSDGEGNDNSSIEAIAQNCLMLELSYTPYHLYHTILPQQDSYNEVVWLISGSDYKIHLITEDKRSHGYTESSIEKYFPEFHNIQAICLWINVYYIQNYKWRLSAIGCECGLVKIALTNVMKLEIVRNWTLRYDKPISNITIFPHVNDVFKPPLSKFNITEDHISNADPLLNILVVTTSNAIVFMDVLHYGMEKDVMLSGSETSDCILCACIADVNMDGQNEILLGTYGQEVIIFSFDNTWKLYLRKLFDAPVHSICYLDITNDGMKELIVLTQRGVHILQHNTIHVKEKWKAVYRDLITKYNNK